MFRRLMNLPLTVASRAAKAFQDRDDARAREKYGTAHDPGTVPVGGQQTSSDVTSVKVDASVLSITAAGVRDMAGKKPVAWVDVRSAAAWGAGHVRGALHIPMSEINVRVSELPWDQFVVTYCDDGVQSAQAVAFFRERGMEDTFALQGGLPSWRAAGGEVVL
ncbi:MAG: rhodanese-like domain-containing protein [Myxococcales bacterium]|nr:rhodanese-like domain-containing protein [Myxococcales bacterium]